MRAVNTSDGEGDTQSELHRPDNMLYKFLNRIQSEIIDSSIEEIASCPGLAQLCNDIIITRSLEGRIAYHSRGNSSRHAMHVVTGHG